MMCPEAWIPNFKQEKVDDWIHLCEGFVGWGGQKAERQRDLENSKAVPEVMEHRV